MSTASEILNTADLLNLEKSFGGWDKVELLWTATYEGDPPVAVIVYEPTPFATAGFVLRQVRFAVFAIEDGKPASKVSGILRSWRDG